MSCDAIQRGLLGLPRPSEPPAAALDHLHDCAACRAFWQQLLELERQIASLPVPPTTAKTALLRKIREETPLAEGSRLVLNRPRWTIRERARQKLALAMALAATLVVFAIGWAVWQHEANKPDVSALVKNLRPLVPRSADDLARARSPRERVQALARAADALFDQSQKLRSADPNNPELVSVAELFNAVVSTGLVQHAATLGAAERALVLTPILTQLEQMRRAATVLAEGPGLAPAAVQSWVVIAKAAGDGEEELRRLVG